MSFCEFEGLKRANFEGFPSSPRLEKYENSILLNPETLKDSKMEVENCKKYALLV